MFGSGIIKGLSVTLKHFLESYLEDLRRFPKRYRPDDFDAPPKLGQRGFFTMQYPEEKMRMYPRYRGSLMQVRDPETGDHKCTACGLCARVCPHGCITVDTERDDAGKRRLKSFVVTLEDCIVCGLCVESCAFDALEMSHIYDNATYDKASLTYDLERLLEVGDRHRAELAVGGST
jgi:NADH-quinone oxidoreductase subunit I